MAKDRNYDVDFHARVDAPYWAGLERGELVLQRCTGCRQWMWPAEWRCGECGSFDFEWPQVPPVGQVHSWTRTHYPFVPDFPVPFVHVLVALSHAGDRRVLGVLTGEDVGLEIGAPVQGYIQAASAATRDLPVLRWRLADAGYRQAGA